MSFVTAFFSWLFISVGFPPQGCEAVPQANRLAASCDSSRTPPPGEDDEPGSFDVSSNRTQISNGL